MIKNKTYNRKKIVTVFFVCLTCFLLLLGRMVYLMVFCSQHYTEKAKQLHERERSIKAERGRIIDANGTVIADNKTVCTISVIHSQITDAEQVIRVLTKELGLSEDFVRKRVEKYSAIEKIKSNVDKETGDAIRAYRLDGVKVDEDYKRYYPYEELASKVLGFTGADNQGIIGLEVKYDAYLQGKEGTILTVTDARGVEIETEGEDRLEPQPGNDLYISLDMNIQSYATQLAMQVMETKQAERVSLLVMNPQNGEIMALADVPEFNLNQPYELPAGLQEGQLEGDEKQNALNAMWRNSCISDTYEPGSTFKMITAAAGLEAGVVKESDTFNCPGYIMVEDRRIRCHKTTGHGHQTFVEATMNSCNPVFITVGMRLGIDKYYQYFQDFGLFQKTGVDLPGEAGTIMHKKENMKAVELATVSFGQSLQITPMQLATTASSLINGGKRVTPHFAVMTKNREGSDIKKFSYPVTKNIVSEQTSAAMRSILEKVVAEGSGKNGYVEGARVGGKTATSQTLPRGTGRYIASFLGFAPADNPQVLALVIIHNPQGMYYGGQIAAPVVRQLFENILPYLDEMDYN